MKKLCIGTLFTTLCQAKGNGIKNYDIGQKMLNYVQKDFYSSDAQAFFSRLKNGGAELPDHYIRRFRAIDYHALPSYISEQLAPLIDDSLKIPVVLAFKKVVEEDTYLDNSVCIGYDSQYTKQKVLELEQVNFCEFLANLLYYCITQEKNSPYRHIIKELPENFVKSFKNTSYPIRLGEETKVSSTPLTSTVNRNGFDEIFFEVTHQSHLDLSNPSKLRLFHLNIRNNEFTYEDLEKFLKRNLGQYVFSRAKRNNYKINGDEYSVGLDALQALKKEDGETLGGIFKDLMNYVFLENGLGAPKIYSRYELAHTGDCYVPKNSGVHLFSFSNDFGPINQLVFGCGDVLSDLNGAIDNALKDAMEIKDHIKDERRFVDATLFDRSFSPKESQFLKDTLIPRKGKPDNTNDAFGVFIGYKVEIPGQTPVQLFPEVLKKRMQEDIISCTPHIKERIDHFGLSMHSFYFFFLPLNFKTADDPESIMTEVLGA